MTFRPIRASLIALATLASCGDSVGPSDPIREHYRQTSPAGATGEVWAKTYDKSWLTVTAPGYRWDFKVTRRGNDLTLDGYDPSYGLLHARLEDGGRQLRFVTPRGGDFEEPRVYRAVE